MNDAPCKDCTKRKVGCHSSCEEYTSWCVEHKSILDEQRRQQSYENDFAVTRRMEVTRMTGKKVGSQR